MPMQTKPLCELSAVERGIGTDGCTVIRYDGSDGNTYHEFVNDDGSSVWVVTMH